MIEGELILIRYLDAYDQIIGREMGMKVKELATKTHDCICVAVGFFIQETETYLQIAGELAEDNERCWLYGIPKKTIIEIKKLKVIE